MKYTLVVTKDRDGMQGVAWKNSLVREVLVWNGCYLNLYRGYNYVEVHTCVWTHTDTHINACKSGKIWIKPEVFIRVLYQYHFLDWCTFLKILLVYCFFLSVLDLSCCKWALSNCNEWGLLSICSTWASHCGGSSCCRAWALGHLGFSSNGTWAQ